jgi:hypothetical protein
MRLPAADKRQIFCRRDLMQHFVISLRPLVYRLAPYAMSVRD